MTERPIFTIVTAVYGVAAYLPEFIASIEAQRFDLTRVEVVAVDDGSTDGSLAILEAWAARRPELVRVVSKPNGGQASARNLGLEHARGTWVTFSDPDDRLDPDFLLVADRFATAHPGIAVMASRPVLLDDATGRLTDEHPRRRQYDRGDRVVDLDDEPNAFPGSATVSLFRLDVLRSGHHRFDERVRPNFEDGRFTVDVLLGLERPLAGLLRDAVYEYRKRAAADSTLQRSWAHPGRYDDALEHGYLAVMDAARARFGRVPAWLQQVIVYELSWYLAENDQVSSLVAIAPEAVPRFHDLLGRICAGLDPEVVSVHGVRRMKSVWIDILGHAYRPGPWRSAIAARTKRDPIAGLQRIQYRFTGDPPLARFSVDGREVAPSDAKTASHSFIGRPVLSERIAWLPDGRDTRLTLDGRDVPIVTGWPEPLPPAGISGLPAAIRTFRARPTGEAVAGALRYGLRMVVPVVAAVLRRVARIGRIRRRFAGAWVVMDRIHEAGDNGERLFEHLRAGRPDINAWFVLERGKPDWARMRAAHGDRVVAFGSPTWLLLMLHCRWLLSSHADDPIVRPGLLRFGPRRPTWRYGFLQHGVIKDDLSPWLNRKDADLFVVSTAPEHASVVADDSGYLYTTRETRLTGLPRFDRLLALGRATPPEARDLILVAPTWRSWLMAENDPADRRRVLNESFWDSEYLRAWDLVLRSPAVAAAAAAQGRRIGFMPHPLVQAVLPAMDLPPHVEAIRFVDHDAQAIYARCSLLVTDYSSVAFNVAYIDGPVLYFQFDRDRVLGGGHVGRPGYFDYERDGFGPVVADPAAIEAALVAAIEAGPRPTAMYQTRIDAAFPERDGRCCERVVAAIESLDRPSGSAR